jgi:hypothetical protein
MVKERHPGVKEYLATGQLPPGPAFPFTKIRVNYTLKGEEKQSAISNQ